MDVSYSAPGIDLSLVLFHRSVGADISLLGAGHGAWVCCVRFAKDSIHRLFRSIQGKRLGALGIIPASALGIASPLCMYGTIPIAASFAENGMEHDWLAAFMMSSILLNPQLIFLQHGPGTKDADDTDRLLFPLRYYNWPSSPYILFK